MADRRTYDRDLTPEEKQVADARREQELRRRTEISDFLWLMDDKRGRRFVWRLLRASGLLRINFVPNAMTLSFNEGSRNLGAMLFAEIEELCPEKYLLMVRENRATPAQSKQEPTDD